MNEIIANIIDVLGTVWNTYFEMQILPGITIKNLFIFTWISLTLAQFFRVFVFQRISGNLEE